MFKRVASWGLLCFAGLLFAGCEAPGSAGGGPGRSVGPPSYEAFRVSAEGEDASEPGIAAVDGRIVVAYVVKSGEAGDIYVRSFDAVTKAFSEPVRVNTVPGQARTWYGDPPTVAAGPSGEIYVGWTAKYADGAKGTILFMSVSRDRGATFGEPLRVNDDVEPASHGMHSIAIGPEGKIYFAWLDERYLKRTSTVATPTPNGAHGNTNSNAGPHPAEAEVEPNAELYFAVSDNGKSFGPNQRIAGDVCPCCKTALAVRGGEIFVGYRKVFEGEYRHIAVSRSGDGGATFDGPVQVSDDGWRINACPVSGPAMRFEGEALSIAWYSAGEAGPRGIYLSRSNDGARTFVARKLVEETGGGGTPVWAGTRLLWSSEGQVRGAETASSNPSVSFGAGRNVVAAAMGDGQIYRAIVLTEEDNKSVWLSGDH